MEKTLLSRLTPSFIYYYLITDPYSLLSFYLAIQEFIFVIKLILSSDSSVSFHSSHSQSPHNHHPSPYLLISFSLKSPYPSDLFSIQFPLCSHSSIAWFLSQSYNSFSFSFSLGISLVHPTSK